MGSCSFLTEHPPAVGRKHCVRGQWGKLCWVGESFLMPEPPPSFFAAGMNSNERGKEERERGDCWVKRILFSCSERLHSARWLGYCRWLSPSVSDAARVLLRRDPPRQNLRLGRYPRHHRPVRLLCVRFPASSASHARPAATHHVRCCSSLRYIKFAINGWYTSFYDLLQTSGAMLCSNVTALVDEAEEAKLTESRQKVWLGLVEFLRIVGPYAIFSPAARWLRSHWALRWRMCLMRSYMAGWDPNVAPVEGASQRLHEDTRMFSKGIETCAPRLSRSPARTPGHTTPPTRAFPQVPLCVPQLVLHSLRLHAYPDGPGHEDRAAGVAVLRVAARVRARLDVRQRRPRRRSRARRRHARRQQAGRARGAHLPRPLPTSPHISPHLPNVSPAAS